MHTHTYSTHILSYVSPWPQIYVVYHLIIQWKDSSNTALFFLQDNSHRDPSENTIFAKTLKKTTVFELKCVTMWPNETLGLKLKCFIKWIRFYCNFDLRFNMIWNIFSNENIKPHCQGWFRITWWSNTVVTLDGCISELN